MNTIELFEQFMQKRDLLEYYEFCYRHYRFDVNAEKTLEDFYKSNTPENWISTAFNWAFTKQVKEDKAKGNAYWANLSHEWCLHYRANSYASKLRRDPINAIKEKITGRKPIKYRLKDAIRDYYSTLEDGQKFYGSQLGRYCFERVPEAKRKYTATILQYMNQLKRDGELNYVCLSRKKSQYKKVALY